ncbi:UNVERIFIED_CONTAM: NADH dehydrogenase (ubiquinone) complex I, assembly factor 6 [Siphonaria sp. JEL0065]|nr:NADH dehydrogenase (ubiquinone) complex I, assembly factor 6 [Siphonaria sp. JEL0065]
MTTTTSLLQKTVRAGDFEGYLTTLFAPSHARAAVFALRAFNVEVANVQSAVKNGDLKFVLANQRFGFWRSLVDGVFENKPINHPVAAGLHAAIQTAPLSKQFLHRIINAREADFNSNSLYPTTEALEKYAEQSQSSLLYLQLEACGVQDFKVDLIASHIGKAVGISTVLRSTPVLAQERQFYLPSDLMAKHNLSSEDVFRSGPSTQLADVVFELASQADNHLYTARAEIAEMKDKFPKIALAALLSTVPTELYLKRLEKANFDVFNPELRNRDWRLLYNLWRHHRNGTV